jgi:hypothetical protein
MEQDILGAIPAERRGESAIVEGGYFQQGQSRSSSVIASLGMVAGRCHSKGETVASYDRAVLQSERLIIVYALSNGRDLIDSICPNLKSEKLHLFRVPPPICRMDVRVTLGSCHVERNLKRSGV